MSETPHSEQQEDEPKVKIEQYSDEYRDQVKELVSDIYENELGWRSKSGRPDLEMIPEMYQKDNGNFWIVIRKGRAVGTIGLLDVGKKRATLHRFCVEKDFRGQDKGVSYELFSVLLKFAEARGVEKIFLATHEQAVVAIKFYAKNGFRRIKFDALPEDVASRSYMGKDDMIYELTLKQEK